MASPVSSTITNRVCVITIDNPPVNATGQAVRRGLFEAVTQAAQDSACDAIVITAKGRTFVAGGDVTEFGKPPLEPQLPQVMSCIEASPKPVVVAWHGTALGGGCELGLAAHARVMAADAKVGLPEVKLGLVPGAGGTQRLPRLIGTLKAMELAATGKLLTAEQALECGLADLVVNGDLLQAAIDKARHMVGQAWTRAGEKAVRSEDAALIEQAERDILKKAKGAAAPAEACRLVKLASQTALIDGMADERATFFRLMESEESRALRSIFFAEREAQKVPGLSGVTALPLCHIGVVGGGTMGAGIAISALDAGYAVTLLETSASAIEACRGRIAASYAKAEASGRMSAAEGQARQSKLTLTLDKNALADVDLLIEAVFEDAKIKAELFATLEPILRPNAVLATNTSYLDIEKLAQPLTHRPRFLGLHFFSPANIMRLLEVVRLPTTDDATLTTGLAFGKRLGKLSVVTGVGEGFIGNRILARYRRACEAMLLQGAMPEQVDSALESYGFAMGPFAVQDLAGIDISWRRRRGLEAEGRLTEEARSLFGDALYDMGRLGQKSGAGWYWYEAGKRQVDPVVTELVRKLAAQSGLMPRSYSADEIIATVLDEMAMEGDQILKDGVALRESDIDLVLINGYGFPARRGGPMFQRNLKSAKQ
jgi:3-hydroxyacyl-CoA dehydrogenase